MAAGNTSGNSTMVPQSTARKAALWLAVLLGPCASTLCAQTIPDIPVGAARPMIGTWELVSLTWTPPDGRAVQPWGDATGRITYDANGNVVALLMHERRNEAQS